MQRLKSCTNKVAHMQEKEQDIFLDRMHFTGNDGYQNFPVFAPMLNSLILHRNKKTTNWILTGISSENIKAFNNNP